MARTIVLNLGYNGAKRLYVNPVGRESEIIRVCCATKAHLSWNLAVVSNVCRERCGGGSYLAYNRIHEGF